MARKKHVANAQLESREKPKTDSWHLRGHLSRADAFGIRRPLEPQLARVLFAGLRELKSEGDIPPNMTIRSRMHVTILPQRLIRGQVSKSLEACYRLGQISEKLERDCTPEAEDIPAYIGGVSVRNGRSIQASLVSPTLDTEQGMVGTVLEDSGLKGFHRYFAENTMHMTLGDSKKPISITEQRHVTHIVHEAVDQMLQENALQFGPWQIYTGAK